jgi:integrase
MGASVEVYVRYAWVRDRSLRILSLFRRIGPMERENGTDAARDRVLLLLGLAGGLRLSELSALLVEDLTFVERGTVILIRHSKTH